ncbi:hypothetical protein [Streptomyces olivaceus]
MRGGPRREDQSSRVDQFTSIVDDQIHAVQELSQVDDGDHT